MKKKRKIIQTTEKSKNFTSKNIWHIYHFIDISEFDRLIKESYPKKLHISFNQLHNPQIL